MRSDVLCQESFGSVTYLSIMKQHDPFPVPVLNMYVPLLHNIEIWVRMK